MTRAPRSRFPSGDLKIALGIMYKRDEYFLPRRSDRFRYLVDGYKDVALSCPSADVERIGSQHQYRIEAVLPLAEWRDRSGAERGGTGLPPLEVTWAQGAWMRKKRNLSTTLCGC